MGGELWGGHDDTENWEVHRTHTWSYVPTVQGRTVGQYVDHAEQLAPLLAQQFDHYHYTASARPVDAFGDATTHRQLEPGTARCAAYRVGIGSPCGRNQPSEVAELVRVVAAVAEVLPWQFHPGSQAECRAGWRGPLFDVTRSQFRHRAAFNGAFGRDLNVDARVPSARSHSAPARPHRCPPALRPQGRRVLAQQPLW